MAKQFIIAAMEEVLGEYILNMSRDNLKIAALKGQIKLEKVQLDGDLIASHVLGAVGLSGFGVLSCAAETIQIHVPWNALETEPTTLEIKGVHLVCVPLTAATAHQRYGGTGRGSGSSNSNTTSSSSTALDDPRCTLRTRAKRLVLARLERNFWNGQIPDEGPPMKRIARAVREIERDWKKSSRRRRKRQSSANRQAQSGNANSADAEEALDNLVHDCMSETTDSSFFSDDDDRAPADSFSVDDLPEVPRDWKVKLREKVFRNVEATLQDVHIRCEVSAHGLDTVYQQHSRPATAEPSFVQKQPEERAFALGFTLENLVVRTANGQWEVGSHEISEADGSAMSSSKGNLGPNMYAVKNNKIGFFNKISLYWDDEPPLLLAETDMLRGNLRKISPEQVQSRISSAMKALFRQPEPGKKIRQSLSEPVPLDMDESKPHQYICESLEVEMRGRTSDRSLPGPISCSFDVLPFEFTFNVRPHQFLQYQRLKMAIKSQQRFDTMLRQRPTVSPLQNPKAWWKYSIACVTSRPNSRPWEDVLRIIKSRPRYIELVIKKNVSKSDNNAYHAGLSMPESSELLALEDLLPIESLTAFHLIALRSAYRLQKRDKGTSKLPPISDPRQPTDQIPRDTRRKMGHFRMLRGSSRSKTFHRLTDSEFEAPLMYGQPRELEVPKTPRMETSVARRPEDCLATSQTVSLFEAMTMRLGKKAWFVDCKLHDAKVNVVLLNTEGDIPVATCVTRASGAARSFGLGKRDLLFDVSQFDVFHGGSEILFVRAAEGNAISEEHELIESGGSPRRGTSLRLWRKRGAETGAPDLETPSRYLELPPEGTVCRIAAAKVHGKHFLSMSAHPATLVWTTTLLSDLSEFSPSESLELQSNLSQHIRNAATPLARKAQLALLSPASMALHINISAPKVWLPMISNDSQGALFLDSGLLKFSSVKGVGESEVHLQAQVSDIRVKFLRGRTLPSLPENAQVHLLSHLMETGVGRSETSVVQPFSITLNTISSMIQQDDFGTSWLTDGFEVGSPVRRVMVEIGPVRLNLVDAEVLARAFGRWYSKGIRRVRARVSIGSVEQSTSHGSHRTVESAPEARFPLDSIHPVSVPVIMSLRIKKLEIALEGHSKTQLLVDDDRSLAPLDSFHKSSPSTRAYVVEVIGIDITRLRLSQQTKTSFSVSDAGIVRLADGSSYNPMSVRREVSETQYTILSRCFSPNKSLGGGAVLTASHFHDGITHLDEVEVDIASTVLRVTPTTLKDCAKAIKKIAEVTQLLTREMERKVHEEGRQARRRDRSGRNDATFQTGVSLERAASPTFSEAMTVHTALDPPALRSSIDSSILFRVTLKESTILAGCPTEATRKTKPRQNKSTSFAVIQVLSNTLIMFQSIENPDTTGTKTLHVSIDNLSSLVNTEFERVSPSQVPPMIGPTGVEFRIVYSTECLGCIVSQEISFDCDVMKCCLTPNDLMIMLSIFSKMFDRLRVVDLSHGVNTELQEQRNGPRARPFSSVVRYQRKGTGIATRVRLDVQTFSFVLLRAYKSHSGAPEFLDINLQEIKGHLEGCLSALSGDCCAEVSVKFFNSEAADWEHAIEPFLFRLTIDQMPNELLLRLNTEQQIQLNLTGKLFRDFSEMKFDIRRDTLSAGYSNGEVLSPSVLSTVGLRRASEARSVNLKNLCGFDVCVLPTSSALNIESGLVPAGSESILNGLGSITKEDIAGELSLSLIVPESAFSKIGPRQPISELRVGPSVSAHKRLCILKPFPASVDYPGYVESNGGSKSSDSALSEASASPRPHYGAEPVVELCMHIQRLRSSVADVFSLKKGHDLLSSSIWSPENSLNIDVTTFRPKGESEDATGGNLAPLFPDCKSQKAVKSNWLRPYLKNDTPEWTDTTCTLRMARDRVMLPDRNWIWVDDWNVDISGALCESTDADGWEYQEDFVGFGRFSRHYQRGDSCRRRRWTRTRIERPLRLKDPNQIFKIVWETSEDDNGNYSITVRSHVRLKNSTAGPLGLFVYSPSWDSDTFVGIAQPGEWQCVPVLFATAVYLRLARVRRSHETVSLEDTTMTGRMMILPSSYTASRFVRTFMHLEDVSRTTLHFMLEIKCERGMVDIIVEPVVRIVNLLPCQLECQLGEVITSGDRRPHDSRPAVGGDEIKIAKTETLSIRTGEEKACTAVSPWLNPHISLRLPGYRWSSWFRIVNRKANSTTWRPSALEEDCQFLSKKEGDFPDEFKWVVKFERMGQSGDPLLVVLSIECAHTPILRVYAQYLVVDKTGFGCRFTDAFVDLLGSAPNAEVSRRSHILPHDANNPDMKGDMTTPGHQWSIGMSGMTMYFSRREKLALAIETGAGNGKRFRKSQTVRSKWVSPMDVSNVMPKTAFSVDELNGIKRFELAINVTICPGAFGRTKLISLLPRYQIVNLLHRELVFAQDGCLGAETLIPSQSSVPFHWEQGILEPKVRLGAPSIQERDSRAFGKCWTNGKLRLDRVGITAMRLPTDNTLSRSPMVIQAEVRLATKDQSSAVVVVIWSANEKSNPLYLLRNTSLYTILCRQPLQKDEEEKVGSNGHPFMVDGCSPSALVHDSFECGAEIGPMIRNFLGVEKIQDFVWVLSPGDVVCFGFDDPEKPQILEWTYVGRGLPSFHEECRKAQMEVNAMGSSSILAVAGGGRIVCQIGAEHSTKVIEFMTYGNSSVLENLDECLNLSTLLNDDLKSPINISSDITQRESPIQIVDEDDAVAFSIRVDVPSLGISVIDNVHPKRHGREILLGNLETICFSFSQTREGYHEIEAHLMSMQVDNHVMKSVHPVLVFCPRIHESEPLLHVSAVRRLQPLSNTFVFRYAAIRLLEVDIFLDRRTAETIATFVEPLTAQKEETQEAPAWIDKMTTSMAKKFATPDRRAPRDIEQIIQSANSGRIYFEQLHLHPVRLGLTFSQEWIERNPAVESMMMFQFIRGMASIADAPLTFTSFMAGHVFEAPQALFRVVATHYSSQLTKQIFGILGSLAILGAPADFITNVGTGVRDFFYEPINGAVHGPRQFIEGLEAGTQSLARGVFVGVVRGAANVTEVVNGNLVGLAADDDFIDERKAHQRMLTDAMSRGGRKRTFGDSLFLAGASIARGVRSGAMGIVEQPPIYASKHGPVGFLKGVGKAMVGAIVKPMVGVGDGAVLVMNHMSDMTSDKHVLPMFPKRLRRALPSRSTEQPNLVKLLPYDERAAKAQKIVTVGESVDDVYIGHINIPSHLIIASEQCLWAIDRRSRDPWCVNWEEISHFAPMDRGVRVVVFGQTGLKTYLFQTDSGCQAQFLALLTMQLRKMGNSSDLNSSLLNAETESLSRQQIPGMKVRQLNHVFGSCNNTQSRLRGTIKDEIDLVEQCFARVNPLGSESSAFLKTLDEIAWDLVSSWGQVFSGLSSRRCLVAGVINGTLHVLQIKSYKLVEGGSQCYSIPTKEFDSEQGLLYPGGCVLFWGWGVVPNLSQPGSVFMRIETNGFSCDLADQKIRERYAEATPGYRVGFLEKSYDESGWWAKYWLLVRET